MSQDSKRSSGSFEESSSDSKGPKSYKILSSRHSTILDKHHTHVDKKEKEKEKEKDKIEKKEKEKDKEREKEEKKEAKRRSILEKSVSTQQIGANTKPDKSKKRLSLGKPSPTLSRVSETEPAANTSTPTDDKATLFYERIKKLRENGHKRVRSEGVDMKYKTLMEKKKKNTLSVPGTPETPTKEKKKLSPRKLFKRTTSSREMDRKTYGDVNPYATLSRHASVQTIVIDPETGTKKTHRKSRSFTSLQDVFQEMERQERLGLEPTGLIESNSKKGSASSIASVGSTSSVSTPKMEHVNNKNLSSPNLIATNVPNPDQDSLGPIRSPSVPVHINTRKRRSLSASADDSDTHSSPSTRKFSRTLDVRGANMQRAAKEGEKSDKKEKRKSTLSSLTSAVLSPIFKKRKDKDRLKHSNSEARIDRSSFEPEVQKSASSADVVVQLIHSEEYLPEQYKGKDMSLSSGGIPQIEISDDKRHMVAQEILVTERSYCASLSRVITYYLIPFRTAAMSPSPIISNDEIKKIFGQLEVIYGFNNMFLGQLEEKVKNWSASTQIGLTFLQMADFFKIYSAYFNNYKLASQTIATVKSYPAFQKHIMSDEILKNCGLTTLADFLIMPVQRLPRYLLLLNEIKKHTPEAHPDHPILVKAIAKMMDIANENENMQREVDNLQKMATLQRLLNYDLLDVGHRRFIKQGPLIKLFEDGSKQEREYILLSDILIETKKKKKDREDSDVSPRGNQELKRKNIIQLSSVAVTVNPDTEVKNSFTLFTVSEGKPIKFVASNAPERDSWVESIENAIKQIVEKANSRVKRQDTKTGLLGQSPATQ